MFDNAGCGHEAVRGVHIKKAIWLAIAATVPSFACGEADLCVDGAYEGTIALEADGYVFAEPPSLLSPGTREVIPYSEMPFASCRRIGGLFVQRDGAILDSDHYPLLEELGFISLQTEDEGGPRKLDAITGFDGVVRLGSIRSASNLQSGVAPVGEISGFNNVERLEGSLLSTADITGFASLQQVDGDLLVPQFQSTSALERVGGNLTLGSTWDVVNLPNLREVGGDLVLAGTRATTLGFPALREIGGKLEIDANSLLRSWEGLPAGSRIGGDFIGTFNSPIKDDDFEEWIESGRTEVSGSIRICANYSEGERTCSGR